MVIHSYIYDTVLCFGGQYRMSSSQSAALTLGSFPEHEEIVQLLLLLHADTKFRSFQFPWGINSCSGKTEVEFPRDKQSGETIAFKVKHDSVENMVTVHRYGSTLSIENRDYPFSPSGTKVGLLVRTLNETPSYMQAIEALTISSQTYPYCIQSGDLSVVAHMLWEDRESRHAFDAFVKNPESKGNQDRVIRSLNRTV